MEHISIDAKQRINENNDIDKLLRQILAELHFLKEQNKELKEKMENYLKEINILNKELLKSREEANLDFLTGLANRRSFERLLDDYLKMVKEKDLEISLILLDVDHFKKINDTYGHDIGDLVLKDIGFVLKKYLRGGRFKIYRQLLTKEKFML